MVTMIIFIIPPHPNHRNGGNDDYLPPKSPEWRRWLSLSSPTQIIKLETTMIISRPNGDDDYYYHLSRPNHWNDDDDANASIAINATTEIMLPGRIKKANVWYLVDQMMMMMAMMEDHMTMTMMMVLWKAMRYSLSDRDTCVASTHYPGGHTLSIISIIIIIISRAHTIFHN